MNPAILLTASRLVIALFFSFYFIQAVQGRIYDADKSSLLIAILCVILIELSDAFDGWIARRNHEVTQFGKIFDPICDSVSRQTIFCTFMYCGLIPLWMFLVFLYRDAILWLIRILCAADGTVVAARMSGKLKAILQAIGTFLVLIAVAAHAWNITALPHSFLGFHPAFWIMTVPTIFTFLSMFDYLIPYWPVIRKMMIPVK